MAPACRVRPDRQAIRPRGVFAAGALAVAGLVTTGLVTTGLVTTGLVAAVLPAAPAHAGVVAPQPVVEGPVLVDRVTDQRWIPRGVNWPDLEYSCVGTSGSNGWDAGPRHSLAETTAMAAWGIDVVRLPLNQDCWLGTDGATAGTNPSTATYRSEVATRVALAHAAGLAVILDLHWSAPSGTLAVHDQRAMPDNQSAPFWTSVAAAFKDDPSVMFDVFNEPFSPDWIWPGRAGATHVSWDCWRDGGCQVPDLTQAGSPSAGTPTYTVTGMTSLVAAIRGAGATQPIILSGMEFGNDLTGWLTHLPSDPQLVAGWHDYAHQSCPRSCWTGMVDPIAHSTPVVMTETGYAGGDPSWLDDAMAFGERHGIGFMPWAWWNLSAGEIASKGDYALLEPGSFAPHAPAGRVLRARLTATPIAPMDPADMVVPPTTNPTGPLVVQAPLAAVFGTKPRLLGTAAVHHRLRVRPGSWTWGSRFSYVWVRNGRPIVGVSGPSYRLRRADRHARIVVRVTGRRPGYLSLTRTSTARRVR